MAAQTVNQILRSGSDAEFRAWGKSISDQMAAGGWVKTADTGQINWTTVAAPSTTNEIRGFEMWSSNDAGGGKVNFLVKLEYGSGASAANQPRVRLTVGWTSDGSGNLTGTVSMMMICQVNTTASATPVGCNLAAGSGWLAMVLGTASSNNLFFSVERTKAADLSDQNEVLIICQHNNTWTNQVVNQSRNYPIQQTTTTGIIPSSSNSVQDGTVGLGLQFGTRGGFTNPSVNIFGVNGTQLGSEQSQVEIESYGTHNYIVNVSVTSLLFMGNGSTRILSRFE